MSIGFCSWVMVNQSETVGPIRVSVGNIVSSDVKTLTSLGFSVDDSVCSSIRSLKVSDGDSSSSSYIEPACLKAGIKIDTDKLSKMESDDELLLKIQFKFVSSVSTPTVNGLSIYPQNYQYFAFDGIKATNVHFLNTFYYPVKSDSRMCLYDLARLDSTYPVYKSSTDSNPDYRVPLTLSFSLDKIQSAFLESSSASYQVIYSLTTKGVNS